MNEKKTTNGTIGNSVQSMGLAEGSIAPLTDVTHMERYSFGSMPSISESDSIGKREQYRYSISSTNKIPSHNPNGFNPDDVAGFEYFGDRDDNDELQSYGASNEGIKRTTYRMFESDPEKYTHSLLEQVLYELKHKFDVPEKLIKDVQDISKIEEIYTYSHIEVQNMVDVYYAGRDVQEKDLDINFPISEWTLKLQG